MSDTPFITAPGAAILVPETEPTIPVAENIDEPTGTPMDNAAPDTFEGDPLEAAMSAIFEARGVKPVENEPVEVPAPGAVTEVANEDTPVVAVQPAPVVDPATPAPAPAAPTPEPQHVPAWTFGERQFTQEDVAESVELLDWSRSLRPDQVVGINEYLAGNVKIVPVGAPDPAVGPAGVGAPPAPAGNPTPAPILAELDPDDPVSVQLHAQAQQLAQMQQLLESQQQMEAQRQAQVHRDTVMQGITAAQTTFAESRGLDQAQVDRLSDVAGAMQIIPSLNHKHGGNVQAAMAEALEMAFWATPEFRDAAVQAQLQQQLDSTNQQQASIESRKQKAAALAGGGAPPPRVAPAPTQMTKEQRHQAMIAEVAQVTQG